MCCGAPAVLNKKVTFFWFSFASPLAFSIAAYGFVAEFLFGVNVAFFIAGVVFLAGCLVLSKRPALMAPLCFAHRNHWNAGNLFAGSSALVGLSMLLVIVFFPRFCAEPFYVVTF